MRNYFILNGVDSRDFGVYISGQGTFDAPQKSYTFYNVPGRDGALLSSDNRLENATLTYDAFIYKDFNENVANFRTFLLSLNGYTKLTDSYHPDEFRYAVYTGPFEPKVQSKNDAGSFKITFSCKPQRYLLSGEAETVIGVGTGTIRGKRFEVAGSVINPAILNGYPKRTPQSGTPFAPVNIDTISSIGFSLYTSDGVNPVMDLFDIYSSNITVTLPPKSPLAAECLIAGEIDLLTGLGTADIVRAAMPKTGWTYSGGVFRYNSPVGINTVVACSHYTPGESLSMDDYRVWFDTPELCVSDPRFATAAAFMAWLADNDIYLAGAASGVDLSVTTYSPNFPVSYRFMFQALPLNSDSEVEVGYNPTGFFENPTYMKARPLITATVVSSSGGIFTINNDTVTIAPGVEEVVIDCEMQDCYFGNTNLNNMVSFAPTYDFPVLLPGNNEITISNGITKMVVKPRWWRV